MAKKIIGNFIKKTTSSPKTDEVKGKNKSSGNMSGNWYKSDYQTLMLRRNIMLLITFISIFITVISLFIVLNISSKKKVEPFLVNIDTKTGGASIVDKFSVKRFTAEEMMTRYFLTIYLKSREEYDSIDYKYNYYTIIRLMSSPENYADFARGLRRDTSPINVLGDKASIDVKIKSIQFTDLNTARIRFTKIITSSRASSIMEEEHKIATILYEYNDSLILEKEERYINPINFVVNRYLVDNEFS